MILELTHVTLVVRDQDEASAWYRRHFGWEVRSDRKVAGKFRWLSMGVPGQPLPEIVLQAPNPEEHGPNGFARKQKQIGETPTWVLRVDDVEKTVEALRAGGVTIVVEPARQPWGTNALVADLYGNLFSLLAKQ